MTYIHSDKLGIRPIVCLKANVRLVKNNERYDLTQGEIPLVTDVIYSALDDTITIKALDDDGIIGYAVTEYNIEPTSFIGCTSTKLLTRIVEGATPNTTYYVWVKDMDGNVSLGKEFKTGRIVTKAEIKSNPENYYGAYVNYRDINGEPFVDEMHVPIQWRIFYADQNNIFLIASRRTGEREYVSGAAAIADLTTIKSTYVNENYADWSKDGVTYGMFRDSYNEVRGNNPEQNLTESQDEKYIWTNQNHVSRLAGLQTGLYYYGDVYFLASVDIRDAKLYVAGHNTDYDDKNGWVLHHQYAWGIGRYTLDGMSKY